MRMMPPEIPTRNNRWRTDAIIRTRKTVRLPDDLALKLEQASAAWGISENEALCRIVSHFFNKE